MDGTIIFTIWCTIYYYIVDCVCESWLRVWRLARFYVPAWLLARKSMCDAIPSSCVILVARCIRRWLERLDEAVELLDFAPTVDCIIFVLALGYTASDVFASTLMHLRLWFCCGKHWMTALNVRFVVNTCKHCPFDRSAKTMATAQFLCVYVCIDCELFTHETHSNQANHYKGENNL